MILTMIVNLICAGLIVLLYFVITDNAEEKEAVRKKYLNSITGRNDEKK